MERKAERQFSLGNYDTAKNSLLTGGLENHTYAQNKTHAKNKQTNKNPEKTLYFHLRLILRVKENRK